MNASFRGNSDEIGMFGPETDLIISLAAVLILFITVEKKRNNDELKSVKTTQVQVMKGIWEMTPSDRRSIKQDSLGKTDNFTFKIYDKDAVNIKEKYIGDVRVENYDYRQKFIFGDAVLFDEGDDQLKAEGAKIMNVVFDNDSIKSKMDYIEEVRIEGHADSKPAKQFKYGNAQLASMRALGVFKYFIDEEIFSPNTILMSASSYGEHNPVRRVTQKGNKRHITRHINLSDYNLDDTMKKNNRRIEIVITYTPNKL